MIAKRLLIPAWLLAQWPSPSAAEEQPTPVEAPAESSAKALERPPPWTESHAAGWLLTGSSLALGAALTASGLTIECDQALECRRDASLLVWGGFGVASLGSMFGFVILERAEHAEERDSPPSGLTLSVSGHF